MAFDGLVCGSSTAGAYKNLTTSSCEFSGGTAPPHCSTSPPSPGSKMDRRPSPDQISPVYGPKPRGRLRAS